MAVAAQTIEGAEPALRLRGVGRRFGGLRAVADVDLEIGPGERRAILGPNGAGKTTLFNVISGETPPSEGTVELFGQDITHLSSRQTALLGLSRTFQTSRTFLGLSVEDNIYLAVLGVRAGHLRPIILRKRDGEMRDKARAIAQRVGLGGRLQTLSGELAHGEHRQLEIGLALGKDPKLMLLDEPAAGLSRGERQNLTELLLALDPGITLILIEHDMDVALRVGQWVTMMHDGRIIAEGTPADIRASQLVHDLYLGSRYYEE
jgi:branched-chain amino acid transport system ATP-binding protein